MMIDPVQIEESASLSCIDLEQEIVPLKRKMNAVFLAQ